MREAAEEPLGPREGRYANYFRVGHTAHEFLFECGQAFQKEQEPQLYARIVTSPPYAKAFMEALARSVEQFEAEFGKIPALDPESMP
jgi:hypothetical protein